MQSKDYYKILSIDTDASAKEIKTSYRKLALKYHPDKANGNPFAETKFKEIQEAYSVLSNQKKKKEYDKHAVKFSKKKAYTAPVTPETILESFRKLNRDVSSLDAFRMNHHALYQKIEQLLSTSNLAILSEPGDMKTTRLVLVEAIKASEPLPYKLAETICGYLKPIALTDPASLTAITVFLKRKKQQGYWDKYKLIAAIIIAFALCFIIFKSTQ